MDFHNKNMNNNNSFRVQILIRINALHRRNLDIYFETTARHLYICERQQNLGNVFFFIKIKERNHLSRFDSALICTLYTIFYMIPNLNKNENLKKNIFKKKKTENVIKHNLLVILYQHRLLNEPDSSKL